MKWEKGSTFKEDGLCRDDVLIPYEFKINEWTPLEENMGEIYSEEYDYEQSWCAKDIGRERE